MIESQDVAERRRIIGDALEPFFSARARSDMVRASLETTPGYDQALYDDLVANAWLGLAVAEERGGTGLGIGDLLIVIEHAGRVLLPGPFPSAAVAAAVIDDAADANFDDLVRQIAAGEVRTALVLSNEDGLMGAGNLRVSRTGNSVRLSGEAQLIPGALEADLLAVAAVGDKGEGLYLVDSDQVDVAWTPTLDHTRRLATLRFDDAEVNGSIGTTDTVDRARLWSAAAIAADCVGGSARALDMTVEYLKVRRQFERPIGSFQALKHQCANMYVALQSAAASMRWARAESDNGPPGYGAHAAKVTSSAAYQYIAGRAVQLHGGIGFTWEHDASLFIKRAELNAMLFGDRAWHLDRLEAGLLRSSVAEGLP